MDKQTKQELKAGLEQSAPVVKNVLAFLIYLRGARSQGGVSPTINDARTAADKWMEHLQDDITEG